MTGGEKLRAALIAGSPDPTAAGDRVRQDGADEDDDYPFIIFRRTGVEYLRGLLGETQATKETFNVECWGATRAESDELEAQALAAVSAAGYYSEGNEPDGLDPDVKVRASVFVIDIWTTYQVG